MANLSIKARYYYFGLLMSVNETESGQKKVLSARGHEDPRGVLP